AFDATGHGNTGVLTNAPGWQPATPPIQNHTPITRRPNGNMLLEFLGEPGVAYTVEASADLTSWQTLATQFASAHGLLEFLDSGTADFPQRFYRIASRAPPSVAVPLATNMTATGAVISAVVKPNGSTTWAYFQYGPTTNYGWQTTPVNV